MQCEKKQLRKKEAEAILKHKPKAHHNRKKEVRYYHCPLCNWWHLTSKESGITKPEDLKVKELERWNKLLTIEN